MFAWLYWFQVLMGDRNGICGNSGNGLGLDNRHGFHSMHSHGHGGALFGNAYQVVFTRLPHL